MMTNAQLGDIALEIGVDAVIGHVNKINEQYQSGCKAGYNQSLRYFRWWMI